MKWQILTSDEFVGWFKIQKAGLQDEILAIVEVLKIHGPNLGRPYVDNIKGSKFNQMKELRVQYKGEPWRILFAFDTKRNALLLVGGNKAGKKDWYKKAIRGADKIFAEHIKNIEG